MSPSVAQQGNDSTTTPLDPPAYAPTTEMRQGYLDRRREETAGLLEAAGAGAWREVLTAMNHVRGTGEMYDFPGVGAAAENVVKAADGERLARLEEYVRTVAEARI